LLSSAIFVFSCALNIDMKKLLIFTTIYCLSAFGLSAQDVTAIINYTDSPDLSDKSLIFYNTNRKLTWDDFKAAPDTNSRAAAVTSAGLGYNDKYSYSDDKGLLTITVYCDFSPNESWVKAVGRNDYILNHEQHHFNISYINTLLFIKKLKDAHFTNDNYKTTIRDLYKDACKQMHDMQMRYDNETNNGLIKDKQAEWTDKLDKQLQQLNATY
jgi:hypothetical protein